MNKLFKFGWILFATVIIASCGTDENNSDQTPTETEPSYKGQEEIEARMLERDTNLALIPANSLIYTHSNGSTEEATAYLNEKGDILKIEERFKDTKTGNYGTRAFYIEKGKRFATKETFLDNNLKPAMFVERQSFYDKNEKVTFTQERAKEYEIDLETAPFKMSKLVDCPVKPVMQILNQEGVYATTFQGFTSNGEMDFIILGENTLEGYTTSLAVQHKEGDIGKLLANERKYVGVPVEVQFERMIDETDFEFQILVSLKILK